METSKLNIKFYLADPDAVKLEEVRSRFSFVDSDPRAADHMLIDVADYGHVPQGPGVVLVAHEANIYLDRLDGRTGLTYSPSSRWTDHLPSVSARHCRALQACRTAR